MWSHLLGSASAIVQLRMGSVPFNNFFSMAWLVHECQRGFCACRRFHIFALSIRIGLTPWFIYIFFYSLLFIVLFTALFHIKILYSTSVSTSLEGGEDITNVSKALTSALWVTINFLVVFAFIRTEDVAAPTPLRVHTHILILFDNFYCQSDYF